MATTIKNLANGQLPAAKGTLYTVPTATTAVVLNIVLVNTDSVDRAVNLYYKKASGTSRRLLPVDTLMVTKTKLTVTERITMGAGDMIEGDAAAANVVDDTISGVERT